MLLCKGKDRVFPGLQVSRIQEAYYNTLVVYFSIQIFEYNEWPPVCLFGRSARVDMWVY